MTSTVWRGNPPALPDYLALIFYFVGVLFFLVVASGFGTADQSPAWLIVGVALLTGAPTIWLSYRMVRVNEELAAAERVMAEANLQMARATERLTQIELDREDREATSLDLVVSPVIFYADLDGYWLVEEGCTWLPLAFEVFNRGRRQVTLRAVAVKVPLEVSGEAPASIEPHVLYRGPLDMARETSDSSEQLVISPLGRAQFAGRFWFRSGLKTEGELNIITVSGESVGRRVHFSFALHDAHNDE